MVRVGLKQFLSRFREDSRGTITVEAVITLPLLVWMLAATFEFFEVHRFKSTREKGTYTIADMISRETTELTPAYIDNAQVLFDEISNDKGVNQIRISVVQYDVDADEYKIAWSQVRGTGDLLELQDADVAAAHDTLPTLADGQQVIVVESTADYQPLFTVGLTNDIEINTRVFTAIRFAPQVCYDGSCG